MGMAQEEIQLKLKELEVSQVVKPIKLPKIFMVKTSKNNVIKVSYEEKEYLDASLYISRSGMTFSGVLKYSAGGELKELRGIYYFSSRKSITVSSKSKITRNIEEMKEIIKKQIHKLDVEKAIIEFNNWKFIIHMEYKIKKAPLIYFLNPIKQGNLHVVCLNEIDFVPSAQSYLYPIQEDGKYYFWIYNHKIICNLPYIIAKPIFQRAGEFSIIYFSGIPYEEAEFIVESNEHETLHFKVNTSKILVFYHPKPIKKIID